MYRNADSASSHPAWGAVPVPGKGTTIRRWAVPPPAAREPVPTVPEEGDSRWRRSNPQPRTVGPHPLDLHPGGDSNFLDQCRNRAGGSGSRRGGAADRAAGCSRGRSGRTDGTAPRAQSTSPRGATGFHRGDRPAARTSRGRRIGGTESGCNRPGTQNQSGPANSPGTGTKSARCQCRGGAARKNDQSQCSKPPPVASPVRKPTRPEAKNTKTSVDVSTVRAGGVESTLAAPLTLAILPILVLC